MPKRSRTKPLRRSESHPSKKPPRVVSKAHQLERDENQSAFDALRQIIAHTEDFQQAIGGKDPLA
jgi:hypothetical protein